MGYLWGYTESEIRKAIKANDDTSKQETKGRQTRRDNVLDKEREEGTQFKPNDRNKKTKPRLK